MDRRERWAEPVEALRAALDGRQAEMWTALPGIVQSFDPAAMTVSVQPAVAGRISDEAGKAASVDLPILPDVPVVFPGGGGFALTFPVAAGDECLVVFASRCIDAWWQSGGVGEPMEPRMHDLSDGFALVGVRSQPHRLSPAVHTGNTQLRADDGSAYVEITPGGAVTAVGPSSVTVRSGGSITLDAPLHAVAGRRRDHGHARRIAQRHGRRDRIEHQPQQPYAPRRQRGDHGRPAMKYRKLTENGDYAFGRGGADMHADTPEAVGQAVLTRLRLFAGEWFVDLKEGTPYVPGVLGKHTQDTYDPVFRERILDTEGVTGIVSYASSFDGETRKLSVRAVIGTVYGETTIQEVF